MGSNTARLSGNGGGRLPDMVAPVRERLEETARDLAQALTKAGESVKSLRPEDVAELMRRSPLAALAVAAGVGFLAALVLWPRER